ncbi:hypothetical protein [Streptomyces sp. NPDC047315]|uniref:hypothetical protein n=1 Tax=Streptomyces sp. NPDC047315 TaxID=3155142 RepID=UPI0033EBA612
MTHLIIPGLKVTHDMYEATRAALAKQVPDRPPLAWEHFVAPAGWTLVPDEDGEAYKAELTLLNTIERTLRANIWYAPDLRGGRQSQPHSHPWAFDAHVLLGRV